MVTQGSLLIAFGKAKLYLTTVIMAGVFYFGYIAILSPATGYDAAAIAQLLTLSTYSITMLLLVYAIVKDKIEDKGMILIAGVPSMASPLIYFYVFH
jgi:O-antigen/teichoic acid export membrane protein